MGACRYAHAFPVAMRHRERQPRGVVFVRLRWALREADRVGPWNSQSAFIQSVTVEDITPARLIAFSVTEHATGTRIVSFSLPGESDTAGAIVRYSTNSATAWAGMTALHNGILSASPFYTTDPDAGLTYFEARAITTDGVVSTAGRRVSINLGSPPQGRDVRWRGAWASGTDYETQDGVSDRGNSFIALQDHTASAANRPNEDGTSNAYWGLLAAAGFAGEDGNGVEYIFARTNSATLSASQRPSNSWGFDSPGVAGGLQWFDGAPGLSEGNEYLWQAERRAVGQPDVGDALSDSFSAPVIVGRWGVNGADGVEGADGSDGNGVEYVFTVTSAATIPGSRRPSNSWGYDTPGTVGGQTWDDGAPSISESNPYLWRAARSVPGDPAQGTAVSDSWGSPRIVGRWGNSGINGADGADGIDGIAGADGSDGLVGEDGTSVEYIFARTSGSAPSNPSNSWGFDEPVSPWNDGAPSLTATINTLWRCERDIEGSPGVGDTVDDDWSSSRVVGRYGDDGDDGQDGQNGQNGPGTGQPAHAARPGRTGRTARPLLVLPAGSTR